MFLGAVRVRVGVGCGGPYTYSERNRGGHNSEIKRISRNDRCSTNIRE